MTHDPLVILPSREESVRGQGRCPGAAIQGEFDRIRAEPVVGVRTPRRRTLLVPARDHPRVRFSRPVFARSDIGWGRTPRPDLGTVATVTRYALGGIRIVNGTLGLLAPAR